VFRILRYAKSGISAKNTIAETRFRIHNAFTIYPEYLDWHKSNGIEAKP